MFPILLYNNVMREIIFKIDDKNSGLMIRDFLRNFGVSSALLTKLKQDENGIKLNGKVFLKTKYFEDILKKSQKSPPAKYSPKEVFYRLSK
jgi:hypothetical protein